MFPLLNKIMAKLERKKILFKTLLLFLSERIIFKKNIPVFNSCYISVINCTLQTVSNASPNPATPIEYNTSVTYTCQPGYDHTDGDLTRTCQANGSLTGSLPECTSKLQRWFVGSDFRLYDGSDLKTYLLMRW